MSRRGVAAALGALALIALGGCAAPGLEQVRLAGAELPRAAHVASVPFFPQERYYCGPAALAMTLAWSGLPVTRADLVPQVYTPGREGTFQADVIAAARNNGRLAVPVTRLDRVLREIAAGHPVLVFQNLALELFPQWHYAVATGYDLDRGDIVLHSGTERDRVTPLSTFAHTWARAGGWALVVLPPAILPETADELPILRAAAGLERANRPAEAAEAYTAMLERWPKSYGATMGLGNARYALGGYAEAVRAFGRATRIRPRTPAAWNNLALALARRDRRVEAVAAARRAVRLGGRDADAYRQTLAEITGSPG